MNAFDEEKRLLGDLEEKTLLIFEQVIDLLVYMLVMFSINSINKHYNFS